LYGTLPDTDIQPGAQYDVFVDGDDGRIAGHRVVKIVIRPKDTLRFEHHYWLEKNSGFPLRSEIVDHDGQSVDVLKFAEISIDANIAAQSLRPSVSLESYTWYASPGKRSQQEIVSEWTNEDLPAGFKLTSARQEVLNTSNEPVMHLVYGDGLARVSVFISESLGTEYKKTDQRGAASSYSVEAQGFLITAVGEVPAETAQAIAEGMRIR
jgi:sigma-E factor negative regulatory protein RseB